SEYHCMAETGRFSPEARVELIEGVIIDMTPIGCRHGGIVSQLTALLLRAVGQRAIVYGQSAVRLGEWSEPQPDIALLKPRIDYYKTSHPGPLDTLLIVEVSDSTLGFDRDVKLPLYAMHGIPEVWIVDVNARRLHQYQRARPGAGADFREQITDRPGHLCLNALPDVAVPLLELWNY
ncbi:MAG TPA: Uma2 family endonuclease, partial [Steroidobacteraceae bacterium]|nr:Uma2 family endonuclease [Steroidobacteraceae bacterium]